MTAPDHFAKTAAKTLAGGGRPHMNFAHELPALELERDCIGWWEMGNAAGVSADLLEADHLYGTARDMQSACCALIERNHANGEKRFTSSIHFLLGFSVELYLKAALAQAKVPSIQRFGHDLKLLMERAEIKGLLDFVNLDALRRVVTILAPGHRDFSFRYPKPGTTLVILVTLPEALVVLQTLDDHLRRNVNVELARAVQKS